MEQTRHFIRECPELPFSPLLDVDEVLINETMDINFKGALFTVQKAVPLMPKTVLSSTHRLTIRWECPIQAAASKAALRSLVRVLAKLLERGIRVNAVSPGPVKPLLSAKPEFLKNSWRSDYKASAVPLKRFGRKRLRKQCYF